VRDRRGRSAPPKPVADALAELRREIAPQTPLAAAQTAWVVAVGEQVAAVTRVTEEHDGTLVVECESAVWTQELTLMEPRLRSALDEAMHGEGPRELRFRTVS
jgi:predicted nucleic acid-binding Zn ribbon protein